MVGTFEGLGEWWVPQRLVGCWWGPQGLAGGGGEGSEGCNWPLELSRSGALRRLVEGWRSS